MTQERPHRSSPGTTKNSITISGGSFSGSAVGIGHVEQRGAHFAETADIQQLRTLLAERAQEIIAHGRDDDEREDLGHELRKIDKELGSPEPDRTAVKTRWKSVLDVLDGVLTAGTKLAGITELITKVFGA